MSNPSRFTSGVATVAADKPLGMYPFPDPFHSGGGQLYGNVTYANDFHTLPATDFARTTVGTGTFALGSEIGGVVVQTTTAGAADSEIDVKNGSGFGFAAGQKAWFLARWKLSDATTCLSRMGLQQGAAVTDGLYFEKASASTDVKLINNIGSTPVTLVTGLITAANATYIDVGFYYDGVDLTVWANDKLIARVLSPTFTTSVLTPVMTITNGSGVARTQTVDYMLASCEIAR